MEARNGYKLGRWIPVGLQVREGGHQKEARERLSGVTAIIYADYTAFTLWQITERTSLRTFLEACLIIKKIKQPNKRNGWSSPST